MGKKKGGKKGGGGGDDDFFADGPPADISGDEAPAPQRKNAFAAMTIDDGPEEVEEEEPKSSANGNANIGGDDEDDYGGGLMAQVKKSAANAKKGGGKKDKKSKKKQQDDDDIWDQLGEDVSGNAVKDNKGDADAMDIDKAPEAGDAADEFPDTTKSKKGKKGGIAAKEDDEGKDSGTATPAGAEEEQPGRILSKKEKEKLKKEREKAKKKAEAAAKQSNQPESKVDDDEAAVDAAEEPEAASSASKNKKKKKGGDKGAVTEQVPAATPTTQTAAQGKKKPSAALAALQARVAAQKKAEEEARAAEEAARKAEEEAERLEKEEAERKEAERLAKKERERLKKEQLKKEGKFLTPKQKAEKAAAEARMQAMIKSGQIKVDGLEDREKDDAASAETSQQQRKSKAVDSRKKKKGPSGPPNKLAPTQNAQPSPAEQEQQATRGPEPEPEPVKAAEPEPPATEAATSPAEDVKDDWDANSDVKDDWDAESEDEQEKEAEAKAELSKAGEKGKGVAKPSPAIKANGSAKGGPAVAERSAAEGARAAAQAAREAASKTAASALAAKKAADRENKGKDDAGIAESSGEDDSDEDDDSDDSDDDSDDSSDDGLTAVQRQAAQKKAEQEQRRDARKAQALAEQSRDNLRSPICCILGHVDTGKTKLLDKIRQTNVQGGEAGGITQQIGATYFPVDVLKEKIRPIDPDDTQVFKTPGLLVIDTPGHESFTNLRTRGSSLCNIAVLVVDIMHGLEQQTLESMRLLKDKRTPFIVALNKVDRLYGWNATPNNGFQDSLSKQNKATQNEFDTRLKATMVAFAEQGFNAVPYYENKNFSKNVSLVPTSAHTGEGIPDMLRLLVQLTQERMAASLMYLSELACTVLEVKIIEGLGTTIDVILSNGVLREGDKIVLCGLGGPIVTYVRALLTPEPLKEMRVKGAYVHHKEVKAALGVKISGPGLEKAISGSRLLVCGEDDDEEELKDDVMADLQDLQKWISTSGKGVCVQASTLGSLEALLEFLKTQNIPVSGIEIGPVFKGSVRRASIMLDKGHTEYAALLCFDVEVHKEAEALAAEIGVRVFSRMTIYNLVDDYKVFADQVVADRQKAAAGTAVWPCRLKILAAFAKREPIILGCEILDGDLRVGTPLCVVKTHADTKKKEVVTLGRVTSLEINKKPKDHVTRKEQGAGVAVRIEAGLNDQSKIFGRHFDEKDEVYSLISRNSIDALKDHFWEQVSTDQKKLIKNLKALLGIP
ncbi:hypothetical protein IE81DRAFT_321345 [Ceraceosorus guamensis]|uniref:Eukaryotic translation initiation factor 5B n=1 Tax=Ceraceosorus guamensis TaxID=1522189 RepID=A0A316W5S9_9BASI|nr:hypothetical protein IE81DRAFT_321345 [Ceraceosorus guamensis]PWN44448.1 hypothetical protein IE81DRAFT_321345 [Ceraceosorus guamensis]